jgi:hypothetical protein
VFREAHGMTKIVRLIIIIIIIIIIIKTLSRCLAAAVS